MVKEDGGGGGRAEAEKGVSRAGSLQPRKFGRDESQRPHSGEMRKRGEGVGNVRKLLYEESMSNEPRCNEGASIPSFVGDVTRQARSKRFEISLRRRESISSGER